MEKDTSKSGYELKRILVTGPESAGKTELVNYLSGRYGGVMVEEYARTYVEGLNRPYTYEDVEHIAKHQLSSYEKDYTGETWVFFDTWLMITRVWFELVYHRVPQWLDDALSGAAFDLVLLCAPDLPWVADGVRENGGKERDRLFKRYEKELVAYGMNWELVSGFGKGRFRMAEEIINTKLAYGTI